LRTLNRRASRPSGAAFRQYPTLFRNEGWVHLLYLTLELGGAQAIS
jgi:hypothetical protein